MQYDDTLKRLVSESLKDIEALAKLEQQCIQHPDDYEAHYKLAEAYAARGRFAEAVTAYRASLACKSDFEPALVGLGIARIFTHYSSAWNGLAKAYETAFYDSNCLKLALSWKAE
jgi:cytochrome c-type biogenesis protein CcmH/NrfG